VVDTNVDPYEDDPKKILRDISKAAQSVGKKIDSDLFVIADRRQGIRKAVGQANPGDIVLVTGKGAEQSMEIGGHSIPWDDRTVVKEELKTI
jgi:UDP-N-acetylmuramoyl-L-alanyl-D-glutamate--2,6-diaminopimelate ligase